MRRVGFKAFREGLLLLALLLTGFAVRYPLTAANVPIAVNVDERLGLGILDRLHGHSWNPELFNYPTFYYYLTYALVTPLGFDNVLQHGRVVNLLIGCALAVATYWLARQVFGSPVASFAAAALATFSPILVHNASYISTDVLSACLSVLSLTFLARFYANARDYDWYVAMMLAGLAMSTKYPAVVILFAYFATEITQSGGISANACSQAQKVSWLDARFPPRVMALALSALAALALGIAVAFPFDHLMAIAATSGGVDSNIDASDVQFLHSVRTRLWMIAAGLVVVAACSWRLRDLASRICTIRPYAGMTLAAAIFLLGSPFVMLSPRDFLYDVGVELKANTMGVDGPQWLAYFHRYLRWESILVLVFFFVGAAASARRDAQTRLLGAYVLLGYVAVGSSNRGYERYLTPLLPVIFALSAWGAWSIARLASGRMPRTAIVVAATGIVLAGFEVGHKLAEVLRGASVRDSAYFAFVAANQLQPRSVLYSGYTAPSVEWKLSGTNTRELSQAALGGEGTVLRSQLTPDTIIAIDGIAERRLSPSVRHLLSPVWIEGNDGVPPYDQLYVYRPKSMATR